MPRNRKNGHKDYFRAAGSHIREPALRMISVTAPPAMQMLFHPANPAHVTRPKKTWKDGSVIETVADKVEPLLLRFVTPPRLVVHKEDLPVAIPCCVPGAGTADGPPKFWLVAYSLYTSTDNIAMLEAFKHVVDSGFKPSATSSSRSQDAEGSWHCGIWRKSAAKPFLSRDGRHEPHQHFMEAFDPIADKLFKNLQRVDQHTAHNMQLSFVSAGRHADFKGVSTSQAAYRIGKLGTTIAFNTGQSESGHFDYSDDLRTLTCVSVFGSSSWEKDNGQGNLVLPNLNLEVELAIGSAIAFQAGSLYHYVKPLNIEDKGKRLAVTSFFEKNAMDYYRANKD